MAFIEMVYRKADSKYCELKVTSSGGIFLNGNDVGYYTASGEIYNNHGRWVSSSDVVSFLVEIGLIKKKWKEVVSSLGEFPRAFYFEKKINWIYFTKK